MVNATRLTTRYAGVIEDESGFPLDSTRAATLALALAREVELGDDAYWRAYVDLLPREVDSLQMWDDDELEALQGSRLIERARRRRALVRREYEATREALGATAPSYETFRWAYATVLARAFVLPDLNCMALLPGLDLYNSARDAEKCTVERLGHVEDDDDETSDETRTSRSRTRAKRKSRFASVSVARRRERSCFTITPTTPRAGRCSNSVSCTTANASEARAWTPSRRVWSARTTHSTRVRARFSPNACSVRLTCAPA